MGKLVEKGLKRLIERPGRYADGDGLYFKTIGQGRAYWTYRYTVAGKGREMSLGPYPEVSLEQARIKHLRLVADVRENIDPLGKRAARGFDKRSGKAITAMVASDSANPTFGEIALSHVEMNEGAWRSRKHRAQWRQSLTQYCLPIWSRPVDQVTTADVLAVLRPMWAAKPETASRLRGRIEKVLNAARVLGHIPEDKANPARWKDHLDGILAPPKKLGARGNHAAMAYEDVPAFMQRLRASDSMTALALEFVILTATRTNETLGARWREIDLVKAVWTIPKERMKINEEFEVPLSDRAIAILAEARSRARKEPEPDSFVFFGMRPKKPLSHTVMSLLIRKLGATCTVHGFRTSFRTWCSEVAHAEFEVAEAALSHRVGSSVSRAYNRTTMTERRRPLMAAWERYVGGEVDTNVVSLRQAATA